MNALIRRITPLIAACSLCWQFCVAAPATSADDRAATVASMGTKRALLVGINRYKAVPQLMGSLNDVAAIRQLLATRWGFAPDNIQVLLDQQATRVAILDALRRLVSESGPNDTVVFHYSGHGSQVQDLNGDEADGLDETLVPWDGRTPGVPDIVDDELDQIFATLRARQVLIILDSCHSGTATRGLEFRARSIPRDDRIDLYREASVGTRAIIPRMESKFLVMSAVAADREALDGPLEGEYHGVFTYALTRTLGATAPGASPRDLFDRLSQEITRLQAQLGQTAIPDPQLEGPPALLDRPLLASAAGVVTTGAAADTPRLAWLDTQVLPNHRVLLAHGLLLGAAPGSTWAIYPPGETAFAPGRAVAVATVTGNAGLDAEATVDPVARIIPAGARAIALQPAPAGAQTAVRLSASAEPRRRDIESLLTRAAHDIKLVDAGTPARFRIDMQGDQLVLQSADGRQVLGTFDASTEQWASAVAKVVARSAGANDLLALDNPSARLQVAARIVGAPVAAAASRNIILVADTRPAPLHFRHAGEPRSPDNSLQLEITASADAYLTIVDVDTEGGVNLLFPASVQRGDYLPEGHVQARQTVRIPDTLESGGRAGFFWDYGPPAGLDTVRIFATTDLATAKLIRERINALRPGGAGTRAIGNETGATPGFDALRHDLAGLATRGIAVTADPSPGQATPAAPDWAATSVTVTVSE